MKDLSLKLSVHNLQEEWEALPEDVKIWHQALAKAQASLATAEQALLHTRSKTEIAIRQDPVKFGLAKTTEDSIKALLAIQPAVIEATNEVNAAKDEVSSTRAIVEALDVKRSALKYLSELTLQGFANSFPSGTKK